MLAQCEQARTRSSQAADATSDKEDETDEQENARLQLQVLIRFFQARARQKHHHDNPNTLHDYGIGQNIDISRTVLEQYAQGIYDKTATDKLPKVTPAKREELKTALQTYKNSKTTQTGAQGTAGSLRNQRDALLREIIAGRMRIQFAADAEWPFTDPANHSIRMQFQLPASRPFVG